jgi:hypothetical protein
MGAHKAAEGVRMKKPARTKARTAKEAKRKTLTFYLADALRTSPSSNPHFGGLFALKLGNSCPRKKADGTAIH